MYYLTRVVHLGMLLLLCLIASAESNPKNIIKEKTNLVYDVTYNGQQFQLTVSMQFRNEGIKYDWATSTPINKKGYYFVSNEALKKSNKIVNLLSFNSEEVNNQFFITLSANLVTDILSNKNIQITTNSENNIKTTFGNKYFHTQSFNYKNNQSNELECVTITDILPDTNNSITFINDVNYPIIIEYNGDWSMKLKSIF